RGIDPPSCSRMTRQPPRCPLFPYTTLFRSLSVNGKVYQDESTADMMISIERQIAYLSDRLELLPGDVICTGSPYGNGSAFGVYLDRKSTRLNSSHVKISYAVFCLKKKKHST